MNLNKDDALLFGVCWIFAEVLGLPVNVLRLLTIVLFVFSPSFIGIYLLLGLIFMLLGVGKIK